MALSIYFQVKALGFQAQLQPPAVTLGQITQPSCFSVSLAVDKQGVAVVRVALETVMGTTSDVICS